MQYYVEIIIFDCNVILLLMLTVEVHRLIMWYYSNIIVSVRTLGWWVWRSQWEIPPWCSVCVSGRSWPRRSAVCSSSAPSGDTAPFNPWPLTPADETRVVTWPADDVCEIFLSRWWTVRYLRGMLMSSVWIIVLFLQNVLLHLWIKLNITFITKFGLLLH